MTDLDLRLCVFAKLCLPSCMTNNLYIIDLSGSIVPNPYSDIALNQME